MVNLLTKLQPTNSSSTISKTAKQKPGINQIFFLFEKQQMSGIQTFLETSCGFRGQFQIYFKKNLKILF